MYKKLKKKYSTYQEWLLSTSAMWSVYLLVGCAGILSALLLVWVLDTKTSFFVSHYQVAEVVQDILPEQFEDIIPEPELDTEAYDLKMLKIANNGRYEVFLNPPEVATTTASSTESVVLEEPETYLYPVPDAPYPKVGAILPFQRIVAYYGNFYSTKMGALGEYPREEMLTRLLKEKENWELADPDTPVVPAIHYIAVTAQASAGEDGKYRLRMPHDQIDYALELAEEVDGIVFLDVQVGFSSVMEEVRLLEKYLSLPNVHLGIDPEFAMKGVHPPGEVIGTVDASEVNEVGEYLASLVQEYDLPPKVLVLHRFTSPMLTNAEDITLIPEMQVVVHMDGWGTPARKFGTYNHIVRPDPVEFTGFKIFYKNDLKPPSERLLTPEDLLTLSPQPMYIQYQ